MSEPNIVGLKARSGAAGHGLVVYRLSSALDAEAQLRASRLLQEIGALRDVPASVNAGTAPTSLYLTGAFDAPEHDRLESFRDRLVARGTALGIVSAHFFEIAPVASAASAPSTTLAFRSLATASSR